LNKQDWNGYQFSANWFKPFHYFENKSFMCFQGYVDYQFGADEDDAGELGLESTGWAHYLSATYKF